MIGNPIERRRSERFAELAEAANGGPRSHRRTSHDEELAPLVELGRALGETARELSEVSRPDPAFRAQLRERLMAADMVDDVDRAKLSRAAFSSQRVAAARRRRVAVAGALAAGVLGLSGVSTASGDALPGDTLYPVKRSTERAQLALASSDVNRGQLFFEFARTRLSEATELGDPAARADALADMDDNITFGMKSLTTAAVERRETGILDNVDEFLDSQAVTLRQLREQAGEAQSVIDDSLALLDSGAERSQRLRAGLLCTADTDLSGDHLGPIPGECGTLPGGSDAAPGEERSTRDASGSPRPTPTESSPHPGPSDTPSGDPQSPSAPKGDGDMFDDLNDTFDNLF